MEDKTQMGTLTEEMERLLSRTCDDLTSLLVNLSGSLKDIECGTHIKIPTDVGFVSYYKLPDGSETLTLNLREKILKEFRDQSEVLNNTEL